MTKSRFAGVRYRFRPWFTVWITVMWCMLMGEITVGNVVGGLLVALVIVFALPLPAMPIAGVEVAWGKFFRYMLRWFWELFYASSRWAGWPQGRSRCPRPPSWNCRCA